MFEFVKLTETMISGLEYEVYMSDAMKQIIDRVSADLFKNALKLLKSGIKIFCRELAEKKIEIVFVDKSKTVEVYSYDFTKGPMGGFLADNISINELACLIHYYQTDYSSLAPIPQPLTLKKELELDSQSFTTPAAELKIGINSKSGLHAVTTWESCTVSVEILFKNRTYKGNNSKLRQLRFDENRTSSMSLRDFSSLDRQIVRFLTQYAEPDGSNFCLNADLAAEFLHCFDEDKAIYVDGRAMIIHSESAVLVGLLKKDGLEVFPGIIVSGTILPLQNYSFVAGKCGFWIGMIGEYWWVPIHADMMWVRNFLTSQCLNLDSSDKVMNLPFSVLEFPDRELKTLPCMPIYYINFPDYENVILSVKFKYFEKELSVSSKSLLIDSGNFWKRNLKLEASAVNEIAVLGFMKEDEHVGHYSISDEEQKGLFFDYVVKNWICEKRHVFLSPESAQSVYSLHDLCFSITASKQKKDFWEFDYELTNRTQGKVTWAKLLKSVKQGRNYIELDNKLLAKIPQKIKELLNAFQGIISNVSGKKFTLKIPNAALIYFMEIGDGVIDEFPAEWLKKQKKFHKSGTKAVEAGTVCFNGELRKYQEEAVNWMFDMLKKGFNSILADEMGLGKTIQALALLNVYKKSDKSELPFIVVCPTSLVENWRKEAELFTPLLKVGVVSGGKRQEIIANIKEYDLLITSYALIKRDIELYSKNKFSILILDEAQHIKNPTTINARVCKEICTEHKIVLTGTPLENSSQDVWAIFDFLNPGMLGNNESFKRMYHGIEEDVEKQKELAERIAPFIMRRHKKEVEQLPERTERVLYCDMLPSQHKLYENILKEGRNTFDMFASGKSTRFDVLSSLTRLRQICCHPCLLPDIMRKGEKESAKMELLKELVLETIDSGQKTLIFSQFTSLLKILKDWLNEEKIIYEYLDGSTVNRQAVIDRFNEQDDIKIFLLSLKAGGTGLNLTSATNVIIYDPWWNPTAELQAADRIHRIGQKMPVTTYKLVVKDSIEEKILDLQKKKQGLFNGIIESSSGMKKISDKELSFLFNSLLG